MTQLIARTLIATFALAAAASSQAALPSVTLTFDQRTGVVGPTDAVDVYVTLTVNADSSPLSFDANVGAPFSFAPLDLPAQGYYNDTTTYGTGLVDFATYTYVQTNTAFGCSGTFTNVCDPAAYAFEFHTANEPGRPSFNFLPALDLQPSVSYSYLFGTFTPQGSVAPGTYTFYSTYASLEFSGLDANGRDMNFSVELGRTCAAGEAADCAFTRTVTAVPEPASAGLLMFGLLGLHLGAARRRRR